MRRAFGPRRVSIETPAKATAEATTKQAEPARWSRRRTVLHRYGGWLFLLLAAASVCCSLFGLRQLAAAGLVDEHSLKAQLVAWLVAGGLWVLALLALFLHRSKDTTHAQRASYGSVLLLCALGLLPRLYALPLPVTHSPDIYRYIWDGAVQRAGHNPYLDPPAAVRYADVQRAQPEAFSRINHRHLPTIYPPMAQHALHGSARLGSPDENVAVAILRWKTLCGLAELALWLVLAGLLHQRSIDLRWLALWLLCPLPAVEIWLNGHLDILGVLFLGLTLLLWPDREGRLKKATIGKTLLSGAAFSLALLVKPLAGVVLPAVLRFSRRRTALWASAGVLTAVLVWLPYRQAGLQVTPSLGEYGRRWRSNDGAFAVLQTVSETVTEIIYRPPYWNPWRVPALARLISGRDRATVWPDELAGFLARLASGLALLWLLRLCIERRLSAPRTGLLLLTGYALLTPVLHPWYLLWPLLLTPLWRQAAWPAVLLCALAPLAYLPLLDELRGLPHRESSLPRLFEHGAAWLSLGLCWRSLHQGLIESAADGLGDGTGTPPGEEDGPAG